MAENWPKWMLNMISRINIDYRGGTLKSNYHIKARHRRPRPISLSCITNAVAMNLESSLYPVLYVLKQWMFSGIHIMLIAIAETSDLRILATAVDERLSRIPQNISRRPSPLSLCFHPDAQKTVKLPNHKLYIVPKLRPPVFLLSLSSHVAW